MPHRVNQTYVSNSDALAAWTPIAHEMLLATARTYRAVVTDEELAAAVQQQSGISHEQPASGWIAKLLDRVALETKRRGEPPLAALCVHEADDLVKAERRLECYRAYADDLPADGGVAVRVARPASQTAARREIRPRATPRPRVEEVPRLRETTCTSCFLIVPAGPTCSSCGATLPS